MSLSLCPILCDPMNYSPPGFSVHGILQARILEWFAILFSRGSSQHRDQTLVSCIAWQVLYRLSPQGSPLAFGILFPGCRKGSPSKVILPGPPPPPQYKNEMLDSPGDSVIKNLSANAGDVGSIPDLGRSHMPWSNEARVPHLLTLCSGAHEPQQEKPPQWEPQALQRRAMKIQHGQKKKSRDSASSKCFRPGNQRVTGSCFSLHCSHFPWPQPKPSTPSWAIEYRKRNCHRMDSLVAPRVPKQSLAEAGGRLSGHHQFSGDLGRFLPCSG